MRPPWLRTSALALILIGFFAAFTAGLQAPPSLARSCALLFGALAVFRLMAGFEKGRE